MESIGESDCCLVDTANSTIHVEEDYLHLLPTQNQQSSWGEEVHVQTKDGRTQIYRVNNGRTGVVGPIRTF